MSSDNFQCKLFSEEITANSLAISKIFNQIDELERRKPILNGVIGFTTDQIPRVTGTIETVKEHADKLERTQWNNMWKTMMGGSIQVVLAVAGSGGAKLVDIGVWLAGQGIDSAMSKAGGGVPYYSKKLKTISATNKSLTKELDKLYSISKSSDAAMKAYYNKYRKNTGCGSVIPELVMLEFLHSAQG